MVRFGDWLRRVCLRSDASGTRGSPLGARGASLGAQGERAAARALRRAGCRILARNLRTPAGEVDLLVREGRLLVLVEVKTTARPGARRRVAHGQRRRLAAAGRWLARQPAFRTRGGAPCTFRLDVALVTLDAGRFVVTIRRDVLPHR